MTIWVKDDKRYSNNMLSKMGLYPNPEKYGFKKLIDVKPALTKYQKLKDVGTQNCKVVYEILDKTPEEIERDLNIAKEKKLTKIKEAFEQEFKTGKIQSSLGFAVDARRSDSKNDLENLQNLMKLNIYPIYFKDADGNIRELSEQDAQILEQELIQAGLQRYQKKWQLEQQIENATTFEELEDIKW